MLDIHKLLSTFLDPFIPDGAFLPGGVKLWIGFGMLLALWWFWQSASQSELVRFGGGLNYVVGPMGSGKSMFGVRQIIGAVVQGRYAVTNVRLLDGWEYRVANRLAWYKSRAKKREWAAHIARFYVYESSLTKAMRYRLPCARCGGDTNSCGHSGPYQEARGVMVWDESHNDLNNRDYQGHGNTREEREYEKNRRRLVLRWGTQLRKLGFVGFLLSQHHENTDAQLRRICNHLIKLQNQRAKSKLAKLLPRRFTLFLAYWFPAHLADSSGAKTASTRTDRYVLPWHRRLYDSWETFHGIDEGIEVENAPLLLPASGYVRAGAPAIAGEGA